MTPQKTYDNSTSARELLAKYGAIIELENGESEFISITQLLNSGVTEVIINQPYEIFTEDSKGFHRYQGNFSFDDLMKLANTLCKYNTKAVSVENPSESIRLPDGERGHIVIPPACEAGKVVFAFRKPSDSRFTLDDYIQSGRLSNFVDTAFYKTAAEIPPEIMP
ncbi:MAG: Flp pilus assembly complex ATPase component TadA, partial [Neisseriaceae bacterium]|nr:Flp pilus assembly complex ATPase component TadA [Neisseriaceae bacterium]